MRKFLLLFTQQHLRLGYLLAEKRHNVKWYNPDTQEFLTTSQKGFVYAWTDENVSSDQECEKFIKENMPSITDIPSIKLDIEEKAYSVQEMLKILNWEETPTNILKLHYLAHYSNRFKKKNDQFLYLSEIEFQTRQYQEALKFWLHESKEMPLEYWNRAISEIKDCLDFGEASKYWNDLCHIAGLKNEVKFYRLLVKLGIEVSWPEFYVKRAKLTHNYRNIKLSELNVSDREILRENTYTVDSKGTKDFDDAFTLLKFGSDFVEFIAHISDVAVHVKEDVENPLFQEARERVASVYLLDSVFNMLPNRLSEDFVSLVENKLRPTIGYHFLISNGIITLKGIKRYFVLVNQNLTYEFVDTIINDDFWKPLYENMLLVNQNRLKSVQRREFSSELKVDISNPESIVVKLSERKSLKSNLIISEMAIQVGIYSGQYFAQNDVPVLYKGNSKWNLKSEFNLAAGSEYYVQCTSPIRRFVDLIIQMQLVHHLETKKVLFKAEELHKYCTHIMEKNCEANLIQKKVLDHYLFLYFSQHQDLEWKIRIVNVEDGQVLITVVEYAYDMYVVGLENVKTNDTFVAKFSKFDIFTHGITARLI